MRKLITLLTFGFALTLNAQIPLVPASGGGSLPSGTNTQTIRYNGTTAEATSGIVTDGTNTAINGAVDANYRLRVYGSPLFEHYTTIRGIDNAGTVFGGQVQPNLRLWNQTATTGDVWHLHSADNGDFNIWSTNIGSGSNIAKLNNTGLSIFNNSATTNAVSNQLKLSANTTGTPANGLGSGILFRAESSTTTDQDVASISAIWSDMTHATRSGALTFSTVSSGTLAEKMRLTKDGYLGLGITTPAKLIHVASTDYNFGVAVGNSSNSTYMVTLGYNTTHNKGGLQSFNNGTVNEVCLNPQGGKVSVGINSSTNVVGLFGNSTTTATTDGSTTAQGIGSRGLYWEDNNNLTYAAIIRANGGTSSGLLIRNTNVASQTQRLLNVANINGSVLKVDGSGYVSINGGTTDNATYQFEAKTSNGFRLFKGTTPVAIHGSSIGQIGTDATFGYLDIRQSTSRQLLGGTTGSPPYACYLSGEGAGPIVIGGSPSSPNSPGTIYDKLVIVNGTNSTYTSGDIIKQAVGGTSTGASARFINVGGGLFAKTNSTGCSNTTVETSLLGTFSGDDLVTANTFLQGRTMRFRADMTYEAAASSQIITFRLKLGTITLMTAPITLSAGSATAGNLSLDFLITSRAAGVNGTLTTTLPSGPIIDNISNTVVSYYTPTYTNATVDTTIDADLNFTAQWTNALAGNILTTTNMTAYIVH